jgi:hypothetical protein
MKRFVSISALAICCSLLAGCYDKVTDANGLTFSFQIWVPIAIILAGIVAVPIGIVLLRRKQYFWGVVLVLGGIAGAFAIAPGMFLDKVIVNQTGFYSRHGFWWNSTVHDIKYDQLNLVQLVVEESTGRRGRKNYSYYFDCSLKSGKRDRVPLGDIMREALPEIAEQFRKHGVTVQMPPNLPN